MDRTNECTDILSLNEKTCGDKQVATTNILTKNGTNDFVVRSNDAPPIELSINFSPNHTLETVEKRYYKRYYKVQSNQEDHLILLHSNRICLLSIAPSHPIIRNDLKIENLEFKVGNPRKPIDRLSNKVSGKGKKGGQSVDENAILCVINCENGSKFIIRSCVRGTLIEINPLVVQTPALLSEKPFSKGHIAVIMPKLPDGLERLKNELLTEDQYNQQTKSSLSEPVSVNS